MKTVHEVKEITGISRRALHYYDEIGLLKPSRTATSGYRLYNEDDLERLQQILFFKEIGFNLKSISEIINNPNFDKVDALKKHLEILKLKKVRLKKLINIVNEALKGDGQMSFKEFDMTEIVNCQEKYKKEVIEKWGSTDTYRESMEKTSKYSKNDWANINKEADQIYKGLAKNMHKQPHSEQVQSLINEWREHITKYFYNCTLDILSGLGKTYITDERFRKNIDRYKTGLAEFMSKAIEHYVQDKHSNQ